MTYTLYKNITTVNRTMNHNKNNKYIVLHYTGNSTDTAKNNAKYFKSVNRGASAHYFVDETTVYQVVEEKDSAWSVGRNYGSNNLFGIVRNDNSLNIEMCSKNGRIADSTFHNTVLLTKSLMEKYNIPASNVLRHFDVCSKKCPGWTGWVGANESLWIKFKNEISAEAAKPSATAQSGTYIFQNVDYSKVFDPVYYANKYADLKRAYGTNAANLFNHFCTFGMQEGRIASAHFNVIKYKEYYADLRNAFGDNLTLYYIHYIICGYRENRKCI